MSFGVTSNAELGFNCSLCQPCAMTICRKPLIYTSDMTRTWAGTAERTSDKCCCGNPMVKGLQVSSGSRYDYTWKSDGCCSAPAIHVTDHMGSREVGKVQYHSYCCPCGKMATTATDTAGNVRYADYYPTCGQLLCPCCKAAPVPQGCCAVFLPCLCYTPVPGMPEGCCSGYSERYVRGVQGPDGPESEPVAHMYNMKRNCCMMCYPLWTGFKDVPSNSDDDKALLAAWLFSAPML